MMYKCMMIAIFAPISQLHCRKDDGDKKKKTQCKVDKADNQKDSKVTEGDVINKKMCAKYYTLPHKGWDSSLTQFADGNAKNKVKCGSKQTATNVEAMCKTLARKECQVNNANQLTSDKVIEGAKINGAFCAKFYDKTKITGWNVNNTGKFHDKDATEKVNCGTPNMEKMCKTIAIAECQVNNATQHTSDKVIAGAKINGAFCKKYYIEATITGWDNNNTGKFHDKDAKETVNCDTPNMEKVCKTIAAKKQCTPNSADKLGSETVDQGAAVTTAMCQKHYNGTFKAETTGAQITCTAEKEAQNLKSECDEMRECQIEDTAQKNNTEKVTAGATINKTMCTKHFNGYFNDNEADHKVKCGETHSSNVKAQCNSIRDNVCDASDNDARLNFQDSATTKKIAHGLTIDLAFCQRLYTVTSGSGTISTSPASTVVCNEGTSNIETECLGAITV